VFGGFKRSGLFAIFGLVVVAALVVVIGLSADPTDANPKGTFALIFGVLAVFLIVLFALQRADLNRASGGDARSSQRSAAEGERDIDDPTTMEDAELWAAMAVKPINSEAVKARAAGWEAGRRSQNLGMIVTLLIFLTVPPIYFFESFLPLLIGGPLIALAAVWGSVRALMPGGELDRGYENVDKAMAPLGLAVSERPSVSIETRDAVTGRVGPKIRGELVLEGERHGRRVRVRLGSTETASRSEVTLAVAGNEFVAGSRKVKVESGPEGIVITRKGGGQSDWLCDLWLAERLAEA
jgi:hypothetical protein